MRKKLLFFFVTILSAVIFVGSVQAEFQVPFLDQVASAFASRPVSIKCRSGKEDGILFWSDGYVLKPTSEQKFSVMRDDVCVGALAIDLDVPEIDDFYKILGAAVLVHEAYHLKRTRYNENEAWTECRAMRHYDIVLYKLGAEPETMNRLMPLMMLNYYIHGTIFSRYMLKSCKIPARYDKWLGK